MNGITNVTVYTEIEDLMRGDGFTPPTQGEYSADAMEKVLRYIKHLRSELDGKRNHVGILGFCRVFWNKVVRRKPASRHFV